MKINVHVIKEGLYYRVWVNGLIHKNKHSTYFDAINSEEFKFFKGLTDDTK